MTRSTHARRDRARCYNIYNAPTHPYTTPPTDPLSVQPRAAAAQVVVLSFLPESPRWLLALHTPAECLDSMRTLRRTNDVRNPQAHGAFSPSFISSHLSLPRPASALAANDTLFCASFVFNAPPHPTPPCPHPPPPQVSKEFNDIYLALSSDARLGESWMDILASKTIRYRLFVCCVIQVAPPPGLSLSPRHQSTIPPKVLPIVAKNIAIQYI